MEKINEKIYQANIDLVDKNRLLEEDKKILIKRINKALEYIEEHTDELSTTLIPKIDFSYKDLKNILKGRYIKDEGSITKSSRTNK